MLSFSADVQAGRKPPAGNAQAVAARNTAIAAALAAENALPEKLSPDVEAQARRLGRAIAAKIVAYGKEHDWLEKPEDRRADGAGSAATKRRQLETGAAEAAAEARAQAGRDEACGCVEIGGEEAEDPLAPEDEEPPDTNVPDQASSKRQRPFCAP